MDEAKEVRCRCGEKVYTVVTTDSRCPQCGGRLFWQCQCGALLERFLDKCPYCGYIRKKRYKSARPTLRLRVIAGAGLLGAVLFAAIGYWLTKLFSQPAVAKGGSPESLPALPVPGGGIITQIISGLILIVLDLMNFSWRIVSEHPILLIFALVGFLIATRLAAQKQHFSWRRLRRHLRRRWGEVTSRWL